MEFERIAYMKFRKLLAAGLAACSLLTLAACKSDDGETDWNQYRQSDGALDSVKTENGGTLTFESVDSDTVKITGYRGPDTLHQVVIPATVRTSEDTSIAPKKVAVIGIRAFHSLSALEEVVLPEGLTTVEDFAFTECRQLKKVTFPSTLETIGNAAFEGCVKLTDIGTLSGSKVAALPQQCFAECTALTSVTVPGTVKTVGRGAFFGCTGLTEVVLEEGVEELTEQCFMNAEKLATLTLPATLKNTDPAADLNFCGDLKLTTVNVPAGAPESVTAYKTDLLEYIQNLIEAETKA